MLRLRWSSQDHDEALRQWEASLEARGDPLRPSDQVYCVIFNDVDGTKRGDWKLAEAPSYRGEKREWAE